MGTPAQTRFSVRWDDARLVIETGSYSAYAGEAGPYTERSEVWALDDERRLVVAITDRRSGADASVRTLIYRK